MARDMNLFSLLPEDDQGDNDLTVLLEAAKNIKSQKKTPSDDNAINAKQPQAAKLPSKPLPPAEAVRAERGRGRGPGRGGRGRGGGRFGGGDHFEGGGEYGNGFGFGGGPGGGRGGFGEDGGGFGGGRGGRRGGFGEDNSGFGGGRGGGRGGFGEEDGGDFRGRGRGRGRGSRGGGRFGGYRGGSGPDDANGFVNPTHQFESDVPAGQWDEGSYDEKKNIEPEIKKPEEEVTQENPMENKEEKKEEEDKEMTLDEYEKLLIDKRKALEALKNEERKVVVDRDFESMQLVDKKKDDGIFIKVKNSEKDRLRRKEAIEKEDKVRKAVSINEFLKPADVEKYHGTSGARARGRGRGRGRGNGGITAARGGYGGSYNDADQVAAPHIEDPVQFPVLAGK